MDFFHEDIEDLKIGNLPSISDENYVNAYYVVRKNIKKGLSWWYDHYCHLAKENDHYDITRRKMRFPEIYWGERSEANTDEMKKRYLFLAENALYFIAPLVREESDAHFSIRQNTKYASDKKNVSWISDIYLLVLIENFLFSDTPVEESILYKGINKLKTNEEFYLDYEKGMDLIRKGNVLEIDDYSPDKISNVDDAMFFLLKQVRGYIQGQADCPNKQRKLCVLDEYFRILRYSNDGKKWVSGYNLSDSDKKTNLENESSVRFNDKKRIPIYRVKSTGVGYSKFINSFKVRRDKQNKGFLCLGMSEEDKQDIYLRLHDELPWDLEVKCEMEEPELNTMNDGRLVRPDNTSPCDLSFRIKEGDIFIYGKSFYHLCGNCGFIVKVDNSLLSEGIKARITERCSKDKNLFRKMELISELQALDDKSLPRHKVLFKSKDEDVSKKTSTFGTITVIR